MAFDIIFELLALAVAITGAVVARRPEILRFVQTQGFESLAVLLRKLEPDHAAAA